MMTLISAFLAHLFYVSSAIGWQSLQQGRAGWRTDPCSRATLPWTPFSNHARLDADKIARIFTRSDNFPNLISRERINLYTGEEEVIYVEFDVLLSSDSFRTVSSWYKKRMTSRLSLMEKT